MAGQTNNNNNNNNIILSPQYNILQLGGLAVWDFSRKLYLRASYHVYKIGCLLVRDISLPAAQLFVIAIENILRGGGI